jgi:hypothetical protein
MLNDLALRAEELITRKVRRDAVSAGAELGCWGRTVGMRVPELGELAPYNKARGVNADDLPYVGEMLAFYGDVGVTPTLEVWAGDASDRLGAALAGRGLYAGTVTATLHARPAGPVRPTPPAASVTVAELGPGDGRDADFFDTLVAGYGLTGARPEHLAMLRAEQDPSVVRRYVAYVDGHPAAAAGLFVDAGAALLSGAATLPAHRRTGCQSALIARRLADAAPHADLAVVTVAYGSPSHANLARAGFHLTHTRTAWRPLGS